MEPLISIIIPVYNVESLLQRCIDSVVNQTYSNIEIILIDDGSTDHSGDICDSYGNNDSRVRIIHKENGGQSSARNIGLEVAKGSFIAFVDSDDYVSPSYIESLYNGLTTYNADISICEYYRETDENLQHISVNCPEGLVAHKQIWELVSKNDYMFFVALWNKLFKASIWEVLRLREGKYAEDSFAMTEYIQKASSVAIVKEPLYFYYQRAGSAVHEYSIKNLDSVEARLERASILKAKGYDDAIKDSLVETAGLLNNAYNSLDLREAINNSRYQELRKRYISVYLSAYKKIELSSRGLRCALYCLSDNYYAHVYRVFHHKKQ